MSDPTQADPDTPAEDRLVADLLVRDRPLPEAPFRRALGRRLADADPGWGPRPDRLWAPALALIAAGSLLLVLGALIGIGGL